MRNRIWHWQCSLKAIQKHIVFRIYIYATTGTLTKPQIHLSTSNLYFCLDPLRSSWVKTRRYTLWHFCLIRSRVPYLAYQRERTFFTRSSLLDWLIPLAKLDCKGLRVLCRTTWQSFCTLCKDTASENCFWLTSYLFIVQKYFLNN